MSRRLFLLFAFSIAIADSSTDITCKGCLPLDEFNFDNVLPRFENVLVKFDVPYPYGERHEEWRKFAESVWGLDDLLLTEVPVRFHGAKDNEGLARKYGAKTKDDLPLVRLFRGGDPKRSFRFKEDLTAYSLKNFIRDKTDVKVSLEGCLDEYDRIAADFIASRNREEVLEETRRRAGGNSRAEVDTYLLYMAKIVEEGIGFVKKEKARLLKIIKKGKVEAKKKHELSRRLNVLHSFEAKEPWNDEEK